MKSLLQIVEALGNLMLDHYGDKVKGIVIGGEAIESLDEEKPLLLLIFLDKVHKISFYAREEIFEYFIKKVESSDIYFGYVKKHGQRPLLYGIIIDPSEISFHNPIVLYLIARGKIIFDKNKIIEKEKNSIGSSVMNIGNTIKIGDINKGEVVDL